MGFECGFVNNEECLRKDDYLENEDVISFWCSMGRYFDTDVCCVCNQNVNEAMDFKVNQDQIVELIKIADEFIRCNDLVHVTPIESEPKVIIVEDDNGEAIKYDISQGFWITQRDNFDEDRLEAYRSLRETLLDIKESGKDCWYYRSW